MLTIYTRNPHMHVRTHTCMPPTIALVSNKLFSLLTHGIQHATASKLFVAVNLYACALDCEMVIGVSQRMRERERDGEKDVRSSRQLSYGRTTHKHRHQGAAEAATAAATYLDVSLLCKKITKQPNSKLYSTVS